MIVWALQDSVENASSDTMNALLFTSSRCTVINISLQGLIDFYTGVDREVLFQMEKYI
jgi:hypothetical protein